MTSKKRDVITAAIDLPDAQLKDLAIQIVRRISHGAIVRTADVAQMIDEAKATVTA